MADSPRSNESELQVLGALLDGFVRSSVKLQIIAGLEGIIREISPDKWYPLKVLFDLQDIVINKYRNPEPILERIGQSMMDNWYHFGPGREIIRNGVDFLRFQGSSDGYRSVVRGPEAKLGSFHLLKLDESAGTALVHSTTPFNRDLERGIILGGMAAANDLDLLDVDNSADRDFFRIRFHGVKDRKRIDELLAADACPKGTVDGEALDLLCKCRGLMAERGRQEAYWRSVFNNLEAAYASVHKMEADLRKTLHEKEVLIREIHHRVKNNLGIVQGLLSSQMSNAEDDLTKRYLADAIHRVGSVAMIYRMLQGEDGTSKINASRYFRDLLRLIFENYAAGRITLDCRIEEVMLDVDTIIPLGLIVNELVSNAIKHAFPSGAGGTLSVSLSHVDGSSYELTVRDSGIGLATGMEIGHAKSLGLAIVGSLVDQIGATLTIGREHGTEFRISFST